MTVAAHSPSTRRFGGPAAWKGPELARRTDWIYPLTSAQQDELIALGRRLEAEGRGVEAVRGLGAQDDRVLNTLRPLMQEVRDALKHGRGFALMRGFPVDAMSPAAARLAYAVMGSLLGLSMPQNRRGELIHDVRDTGADRRDPNVRLSITNAEQDFHTDAADVIGLLCLQKSKAGGVSRIVSSVSVHDALAAEQAALAALLFEPWYFHMKGEQQDGELPYFTLPIAQVINGHLSSFFIGWYIRHAEQLAGVPRLRPEQQAALEAYERVANSPSLYLDMTFERGDVQWLKNSVILHKRTEYEDWSEPERKRHLLRLWLAAPDFDDGIVAIRQGHKVRRS